AGRPPGPRRAQSPLSARLVRADEVGNAAVGARGPAGRRVRAVDGVEAAVVEPPPRRAHVLADVAAGGPDREGSVGGGPGCARAVLRGSGRQKVPAQAAVACLREVVRRGGRKREVAADREPALLAVEGE